MGNRERKRVKEREKSEEARERGKGEVLWFSSNAEVGPEQGWEPAGPHGGERAGASVLEPSLLPARVLMSRKLELASRGSSLSFLLCDSGTANGVKKKSYLSGRVKRDREIFSLLVLLVPPQMVKTTRARPA